MKKLIYLILIIFCSCGKKEDNKTLNKEITKPKGKTMYYYFYSKKAKVSGDAGEWLKLSLNTGLPPKKVTTNGKEFTFANTDSTVIELYKKKYNDAYFVSKSLFGEGKIDIYIE